MISLSHRWQRCHDFKYFGQHKKIYVLGIVTDPDRPDQNRHAHEVLLLGKFIFYFLSKTAIFIAWPL
jgi:hypothetical protein